MAAITVKQPSSTTERDVPCSTQDIGGIPPGLQRFSYAGKYLEDPQRTLEQCVLIATAVMETQARDLHTCYMRLIADMDDSVLQVWRRLLAVQIPEVAAQDSVVCVSAQHSHDCVPAIDIWTCPQLSCRAVRASDWYRVQCAQTDPGMLGGDLCVGQAVDNKMTFPTTWLQFNQLKSSGRPAAAVVEQLQPCPPCFVPFST